MANQEFGLMLARLAIPDGLCCAGMHRTVDMNANILLTSKCLLLFTFVFPSWFCFQYLVGPTYYVFPIWSFSNQPPSPSSPLHLWGFSGYTNKATFCCLCRHKHTQKGQYPPYQVSPASQKCGVTHQYYFSELKMYVLKNVDLIVSSEDMMDHCPIVVAGSDGLWDNLLEVENPSDGTSKNQALKKELEETVNECVQSCSRVDAPCIKAMGSFLKDKIVSKMDSAQGQLDDLSIFVANIEKTSVAEQGLDDVMRHPKFFDEDQLSLPDIQRGLEWVSAVPVERAPDMEISDKSVFGTSYHYCRGRPRNDRAKPRCDDAFGATNQCLVLCDGVGGAGPASGRWARICVKECLTEAAARG
jgi:hypothetical protein